MSPASLISIPFSASNLAYNFVLYRKLEQNSQDLQYLQDSTIEPGSILEMPPSQVVLPDPSKPIRSAEEYLKARDQLIQAERAQGFEGRAHESPLETAAGEVVQRLK